MYKYILAILLLWPLALRAQDVDPLGSLRTAAGGTGLVSDQEPVDIIVSVVNVLLYFVGTIFMILIVWAGFRWMTSAGNTDTVKKARETIINSVIGLVIIFASYVLVNFVITSLVDSVGVGSNTPPAGTGPYLCPGGPGC